MALYPELTRGSTSCSMSSRLGTLLLLLLLLSFLLFTIFTSFLQLSADVDAAVQPK